MDCGRTSSTPAGPLDTVDNLAATTVTSACKLSQLFKVVEFFFMNFNLCFCVFQFYVYIYKTTLHLFFTFPLFVDILIYLISIPQWRLNSTTYTFPFPIVLRFIYFFYPFCLLWEIRSRLKMTGLYAIEFN